MNLSFYIYNYYSYIAYHPFKYSYQFLLIIKKKAKNEQ